MYIQRHSILPVAALFLVSCNQSTSTSKETTKDNNSISVTLPDTSFQHKPLVPFDTSDYVIQLKHMQEFYDIPGELGHIAEGKDYGFLSLSFIMTNTQPKGGPPLHVHETEEAHVLQEGTIHYIMNGKEFTATGPYIVRIPAGTPHTFINAGSSPLHLTAVFPSKYLSYKELGRNPLVKDTIVYHLHKHQ